MIDWIVQTDMSVLHGIQENLRCGFLDAVMPWITKLGDGGIVCIALAFVLLWFPRTRRTGVAMAIALALGFLVGNILLKNLVARVRPYDVDLLIELSVERLTDYSFPSGHTLACFETATVLLIRHRRAGIVAVILAVLVAFSRLYLSMHYPTDVLVGLALGVLFGIVGCVLAERIGRVWEKKYPAHG